MKGKSFLDFPNEIFFFKKNEEVKGGVDLKFRRILRSLNPFLNGQFVIIFERVLYNFLGIG
jgi:hypothetical protein